MVKYLREQLEAKGKCVQTEDEFEIWEIPHRQSLQEYYLLNKENPSRSFSYDSLQEAVSDMKDWTLPKQRVQKIKQSGKLIETIGRYEIWEVPTEYESVYHILDTDEDDLLATTYQKHVADYIAGEYNSMIGDGEEPDDEDLFEFGSSKSMDW